MKKVSELVNTQLTRSVKSYDKLSQSIYQMLHLNPEKHNVWAVVKQQQLTVMTDNSYLGTQLRYQQDAIRNHLNQEFLLELKNTRVKIIPPRAERPKNKERRFIISEKTEKVLSSIAELIEDKDLRESLENLGKCSDK